MKAAIAKYVGIRRARSRQGRYHLTDIFNKLLLQYIKKCDFELFETLLQAIPNRATEWCIARINSIIIHTS